MDNIDIKGVHKAIFQENTVLHKILRQVTKFKWSEREIQKLQNQTVLGRYVENKIVDKIVQILKVKK